MNAAHAAPGRILIVGRGPGVLLDAVALLRARGYAADATNRFDSVLEDYDAGTLDVVLLGGMVPPGTKQHLRTAITARNPGAVVAQGLAGIPAVIAAQAESLHQPPGTACDITYDDARRTLRVVLPAPAHVTVEAWWATSFTPPEPTSTSLLVRDTPLGAGAHTVRLPDEVSSTASFAVVRIAGPVRQSRPSVSVVTVGPMPEAVTRLAAAGDRRLPAVAPVTTRIADG